MGKKYIIELLDDCQSEFKGIMAFGLTQEKQISVELIPEESLRPYTEDTAYAHGYTEAESKYREIRDELEKQAYQRGYKEAYDTAYADAEEIYESGKRAMYQKGLKDAWEAARKISMSKNDGGLSWEAMNDIFGTAGSSKIYKKFTASEAIEKIRQYEQEKDRQAKIEYNFDEIKDVLETTAKECNVSLDEIAEVLRKMKENNG